MGLSVGKCGGSADDIVKKRLPTRIGRWKAAQPIHGGLRLRPPPLGEGFPSGGKASLRRQAAGPRQRSGWILARQGARQVVVRAGGHFVTADRGEEFRHALRIADRPFPLDQLQRAFRGAGVKAGHPFDGRGRHGFAAERAAWTSSASEQAAPRPGSSPSAGAVSFPCPKRFIVQNSGGYLYDAPTRPEVTGILQDASSGRERGMERP